MKSNKSPQQKKAECYKKDCRNTYGERGSNSRFAIRFQKNVNRRVYRHKAEILIKGLENTSTDTDLEYIEEIDSKSKSIPKRAWKKYADTPLGKVVCLKLERRFRIGMNNSINPKCSK